MNVVRCFMAGALCVSAFTANAASIALFGDRGEKSSLSAQLSAQGHTVTDLGTNISSDLLGYDQVWGVHAFDPISASEQVFLTDFLNSGGGIYLTGERPCCETLNSSITTFVNSVLDVTGVQVGGLGDQGSAAVINPNVVGNIGAGLTSWQPSASGGIAGLAPENVLATSTTTGGAVAAAWDMEDFINDAGRLVLMMDVDWFIGMDANDLALLGNIQSFVGEAGVLEAFPVPAPLALFGFGLLGLVYRARQQRVA